MGWLSRGCGLCVHVGLLENSVLHSAAFLVCILQQTGEKAKSGAV